MNELMNEKMKEMQSKGYAKFGGANEVHYGKCGSGVYENWRKKP